MSERELYHLIIDYLNIRGCYVFRVSTGGRGRYRFGLPGQADITGVTPEGRRIEIEVKSETGKLSDEQRAYLTEMLRHRALVLVVNGWQDFINKFNAVLTDAQGIVRKCRILKE